MLQKVTANHEVDRQGNPSGGVTVALGIHINWQKGPLGRGPDRKKPNGAFVEGVIAAAVDRLQFYQRAKGGKYMCRENSLAITRLEEALHWLEARTRDREAREVEGENEP